MEVVRVICERVIKNLITMDTAFPNLLLGLCVAFLTCFILLWEDKAEDKFITFRVKQSPFILTFVSLGAVLASPLPLWGNGKTLKLLSIFVLLVVLSVTSYMDEQTVTFRLGYLLVGLIIQVLLLFVQFCLGNVVLTVMDVKLLGIVIFILGVCSAIRAYSFGDMGLFLVCLLSFLIVGEGDFFSGIVITVFIAMATDVCRHVWYIPRRIKEGKKLRFPMTLHILIGVLFAFFFVA